MTLLKAESIGGTITDPKRVGLVTELAGFSAVIEWVQDSELRGALIATNINILRREAPYLYFVANEYREKPDLTEAYVQEMESRELGRGVWLAHPDFEEETKTIVTAVLLGDILPFVHCLYHDWYCLLCLPEPVSLAEIDNVVTFSPSVTESVRRLLSGGGCLLTCIDHRVMTLRTFDVGYAKYFHRSKPIQASA